MTKEDNSVTLIVKTPTLEITDQQYECDINWTVRALKSHLSNVYPTKPNVEDQKLIYFGHLLADNVTLKNALNKDVGKVHPMHLVCYSKTVPCDKVQSTTKNKCQTETALPTDLRRNPHDENIQTPQNRMPDSLRNNVQQSQSPVFQIPSASVTPGFVFNPDVTQQFAIMQQMYTQYMMQYYNYVQTANMNLAAAASQPAATQVISPAVSEPQQPEPNAQINNENIPPIINEVEEPAINADVLDWLYIFTRFTILLSVVYFYSSLGRCLIIIGIALLIYVYRGGFFCITRQRNRNRVRHNQSHSRRHTSRHTFNSNRIRQTSNHEMSRHSRNTQTSTLKTFITSFFTSLIPEQVNPVNIN